MKIARMLEPDGRIALVSPREEGTWERLEGDLFGELRPAGGLVTGKLLAPVEPCAVYCAGLNYRRHAEETGARIPAYPVLFMKAPSAVTNPFDPVEIPAFLASEEMDYECELAVVIGRAAKNVPRERALDYVLGFTCANDVSARDWQVKRGGSQWCRGKTFDTFCPLGPVLVTPDELDVSDLRISTTLNGTTVQDCQTSDMIFDVPALIEFFSGSTTLRPGTVILTGTPQGVGMARKPPLWLKPGDSVTVEIEGIGQLTNPVVRESPQPGQAAQPENSF